MKKFRIRKVLFLLIFTTIACNTQKANREKELSIEIASGSCEYISEITSSFVAGAMFGALDFLTGIKSSSSTRSNEKLNVIPGYGASVIR